MISFPAGFNFSGPFIIIQTFLYFLTVLNESSMIFVEQALLVARIQSLKPYSPYALGTAELEFCFQAVYLSFLGISFC